MLKSLCLASGLVLSLNALPFAHADEAPAPGAPAVKPASKKEGYPEMRRALKALEAAKRDLEYAAHYFGGHRTKALEATDQAIREVKEGIDYARKEQK